ncbi:MAG: LysR family transcriptional regulator [Helicobacter sp.]|uniref:LysR family transcriptional regulator n=1 Tax=Helicobacter sp. TaxID=218 RepID=UPI0023D4BB4A|nr:LysR family transcriptional regulator [Helicobacter sp.]MDE5925572.1 LysR family transcriptional regulator [Helicobacter sp.]MDE7174982.1 LysR family transcriptional regulator [Helicobacter sp.]
MKIKDLEIFLDLLKSKSPTQTAERFSISQPNVSIVVKRLEKLAGFPLFERIGKKLVPTSRALFLGGMWLEVVQGYYASLESLERTDSQEITGELSIIATHTISEYFLPKIVFEFAKTHRKVKLKLQVAHLKECFLQVKKGAVDLALVEGDIPSQYASTEGLVSEMLHTDSLIVASNDFILASRTRDIKDLLDKIWILREYGSGQREQFVGALAKLGVEIPIFLELNCTTAIKDLVICEGALSVFSEIAIRKELENKVLFPIKIKNLPLEQSFYSLKRQSQLHNPILLKFEEYVLEQSKQ